MYSTLKRFCDALPVGFTAISEERKVILKKIANYIQSKKENNLETKLVYICTHNSRRSHFGQVWAAVAAYYYNVKNVSTYSGGTEETAFNANAIKALEEQSFVIKTEKQKTENSIFHVHYADDLYSTCFSKIYDHEINPKDNFAAIMTCGSAEANCPFIPNCELRIATTYNDPKASDNTPQQNETYYNRSKEIATEIFYVFSLIK